MTHEELKARYRHTLIGHYCEAIRSSNKSAAELGMMMDVFSEKVDKILGQIATLSQETLPAAQNGTARNQPPQGVKR